MPEIAEIFRDHHKEYFRRNNAPPEVIRTIFDIEKCCTPAMGHSILCTCPDCGHLEIRYRSCGNRNCPQCGGHKITEWVEKRLTERLPVDYFMATFTLPREFNFLFRQHPGEAVKTFMKCVSDSLLEMGKSKLHGMVGFMMVYQSWCRNGDFHPHIHALLPCGALSEDKKVWLFPKRRDFLFSEVPLMRLFRGKFNAAIWQLPGADRIRRNVFRNEYVVNIKSVGDGENSFKYLAAYTQRGFIGNDRIVKYNGVKVTFRYRDGETNEDRYRTLSAVEFMELYLQHVLPKGVQRIRYGGIWAAAARKRLNAAKEILILQPVTKVTENPEQLKCLTVSSFIRNERFRCPKCGAKMLYRQTWADSG